MDKRYYDEVRNDITAALEAVANKHGLQTMRATNITVSTNEESFDVKIVCVKQGGKSKEAQRYEYLQAMDKALPVLGAKFRNGAREHVIAGATAGGKIITTAEGKEFSWQRAAIQEIAKRCNLPHG